uniref:basic salivary proline-rich protein 1-like isoform X2 n=1 Tax=Nyctereutes procyonoides TaxID=34880 RepID=UPI002444EB83|nr:basic salivary proline-rich protein 1-like isoform X2 [Nyctereutes procyonoides]
MEAPRGARRAGFPRRHVHGRPSRGPRRPPGRPFTPASSWARVRRGGDRAREPPRQHLPPRGGRPARGTHLAERAAGLSCGDFAAAAHPEREEPGRPPRSRRVRGARGAESRLRRAPLPLPPPLPPRRPPPFHLPPAGRRRAEPSGSNKFERKQSSRR